MKHLNNKEVLKRNLNWKETGDKNQNDRAEISRIPNKERVLRKFNTYRADLNLKLQELIDK